MATRKAASPTAAKIKPTRASVTVLTGPARCGKTSLVLDRYRKSLAAGAPRSTLWLAPTHRAAADILGRLLAPELPACFSPGVMTFEGFAQQVLEASGSAIRPLSGLMKRELIRWLLAEAHEEGRLVHFGPIVGTHGLVDLVSQFISEFKRLEIWPDEFRQACAARGETAKDRELLALYEAYQDRLTKHNLYDAEGRFWSARALLRDGQQKPCERLKLVVVDGFTDFTRTQHEILELLAERVEEIWITLPWEEEPRRPGLFDKTLDTLEQLKNRLGAVQQPVARRQSDWPLMDHLESQLFQNPRAVRDAPDSAGLEILAASREYGEMELVGHRVKELLLKGSAASGGKPVSPGEIAVVFRSLRGCAALVREVFAELGIPFALESEPTLNEVPLCRTLLAILSLAADDWPFRPLLGVLGNNYLRPQWQQGPAVLAAEQFVRRQQIPSGSAALLAAAAERIRDLEQRLAADRAAGAAAAETLQKLESEAREVALAHGLLSRFAQALQALPRRATQGQWHDALIALAHDLGLLDAIAGDENQDRAARDQAAWDRLLRTLRDGEAMFGNLGEAPPELDLPELIDLLTDLLQCEQLPRRHDDVGRVRVLSAASARALEIPYLFFAGLSERAFPSPERHDRLYADSEYRRFREAGLPVPTRDQRGQDEMLLFYEVFTRATRHIWLSYPAINEKAEALLPSPYLIEVIRAAGSTPLRQTSVADLSPVPAAGEAASLRELRIRGMHEALLGEPNLLAGWGTQVKRESLDNVLDALAVIRTRSSQRAFSPFEGVLRDSEAIAWLARTFSAQRHWSPSHLEQYASCPYQFFLQHVLGLEPLEDIGLETDHLSRGSLLHGALAELHQRLNAAHGQGISPAELSEGEFRPHWEAVLDALAAENRGQDVASALQEIDLRLIRSWLVEYHEQHVRYDATWQTLDEPLRPAHFEVSFGQKARGTADPLSKPDPLVLSQAGEQIRVAGRIDRIDVGRCGSVQVFSIVDYKSGSRAPTAPKADAVPDGLSLQLELYALAAQEVLFEGNATGLAAGYWHLRAKGYKSWRAMAQAAGPGQPPQIDPAWASWREQIVRKVLELVRGIRSGEFPVYSLDENCTGRCAFRTVCRVNQVRSLEKVWPHPQSPAD